MPQLPTQWNNDVQAVSMQVASGNPEYVIPLWWASGGSVSTASVGLGAYINKGATGTSTITPTSTKLHTLSSQWTTNTRYALEATISTNNASGVTSAQLWDVTGSALVTGSLVSTTSNTAIVLRSSQFTLTPGRVYAVSLGSNNASYTATLTDASLIVFPQ